MTNHIQEDCVGIPLNPTLENPFTDQPIDLTDVTSVTFILKGPAEDASDRLVRTGAIDGTPTLGKVIYYTTSGDFTTPGGWKWQVWLTFSGGQTWRSEVAKIKVLANI